MKKTYIIYQTDKRSKNKCYFEVEVGETVKGFGRDMRVVRPVKGYGQVIVNNESILLK